MKASKIMATFIMLFLFSLTIYPNLFAACVTNVSGTIVNQTWTKANSPYCVTGDILVAGLTIQPGVTVQFKGNFVFEIAGVLTATGTESEPILFTLEETNTTGWKGFLFNNANPGSQLSYCNIEKSTNSGVSITDMAEPPIIENCIISNNKRVEKGGGLYIVNSGPATLTNCTISNNTCDSSAFPLGGGVYFINGTLLLNNCSINNNICIGTGGTGGSKYSRGGGIYANGILTMSNSIIDNNIVNGIHSNSSPHTYGGGLCCVGDIKIQNCIFKNNKAVATSGGYFPGGSTCNGGAIFVEGVSTIVEVVNSTFYKNSAASGGGGIFAYSDVPTESVIIENAIFWDNTSGQVSGNATVTYSDIQGGYEGTGNENINPIFNNTDELMIVAGSLCIDAGNPDVEYNDTCLPPSLGTVRNDMGAHGGPLACDWPPPDTPVLSVTPTNQNVAKGAGVTTFSVSNTGTGTMSWTAEVTSGGAWLSITSGDSGSNSGIIMCAFTANSTTSHRVGTITVTANDATGSPINVTVTQAGIPSLSVTPINQNVAKGVGTTTFSVSNNGTGTMPWTAEVTSGGSWLSITSGDSGNNSGTITCAFTANTTTSQRIGTITVTANDAIGSPVDVTVTQSLCPPVLSVTPANQSVACTARTTTFAVINTGCGESALWTAAVTSGGDWLSISSGASGSNSGTITCEFTANTGAAARTGTVRVTMTGGTGSPKNVTVTQATCQPVLSVSPTSRNVAKEAGTTTFVVSNIGTGTMPWTAAESPSVGWLSITPTSGSNSGTITCTYTANTTTSTRTATIRVTAAGAIGSPLDVTVIQAEAPPADCFFNRSVQAFYIPGVKMTVTLSADPSPGISNYALEDVPPAGWTVSNWSAGGVYDAAHHKVKFGAFFDINPRTFTYDITPRAGASGVHTFNGTGSMDGTNYPICGVTQVNSGTHHPADIDADFNMVIAEYTGYGAAWKTGTAWPVPPNPIPISYVTKAGQLWKLGESYIYDSLAGNPPECWVNDSNNPVQSFSYASSSSTAVCGMPKDYKPGKTFTVSITVTPLSDVAAYAVEDLFPVGWTVSNISDSGGFDAVANKVKFGPFSDNSPRMLTYDVTPPATASGVYIFTGVASFDGVDIAISGVREIKEAPPVIVGPMLQLLLSD
jgi:parallel beta-helix repeat protein